jgi:hypothetical protein
VSPLERVEHALLGLLILIAAVIALDGLRHADHLRAALRGEPVTFVQLETSGADGFGGP